MCQKDFQYYINRYFKVVSAYLEFKQNSNIQSFLCLLTSYPKSEDKIDKYGKGINIEHLNTLIKLALDRYNIDFNEDEELYFIYNSEDKTAKKYEDEIKSRLKDGERIFVISTYQGLGIGKNIQYKILENNREIEKDFDAIYLDKPTHLLENITGDKEPIEMKASLN